MTIKEIAKILKMSPSTISICLAGRENEPRYRIRAEKAKLIRAFALEHGYVPDTAARNLRSSGDMPPVGLLFTYGSGLEKSLPALRMAMTVLAENGRVGYVIGYAPNEISRALTVLRGMKVCDVIAFGPFYEPCPVNHPEMLVRPNDESAKKVDTYLTDWKIAAKLMENMTVYAVEYRFPKPADGGVSTGLIRMGADLLTLVPKTLRRIKDAGLGPVVTGEWICKEQIFVPELLDSPELILKINHQGSRFVEGIRLADQIMELRKRYPIRSVFIGNDAIAGGIMARLDDCGISIPDDIGVLGWGNDESSAFMRMPLSTFDSFITEHTQLALEAILFGKEIEKSLCRVNSYIQRKSFVFQQENMNGGQNDCI